MKEIRTQKIHDKGRRRRIMIQSEQGRILTEFFKKLESLPICLVDILKGT
jgi:hypothetical protein